MLVYAAYFALQIVRKWDITSGSEVQLDLERKTYLISTIMSYLLGFQLLSLFRSRSKRCHCQTEAAGLC